MNTIRYDDMIKKYHYYKNVIIQDYIKRGIYPKNSQIEQTLNRIDLALPILQDYEIHEGSDFDTAKYNDTLKQIYIDLQYLYEITNITTKSRLNYLKSYIKSHLIDMQNRANAYNMRALIEKNSTSLGNTLINKNDVYPSIVNNKCDIVLSDSIKLYKQSKLACFVTADNISQDDIIIEFLNKKTGDAYYSTIYNIDHNTFSVPGDLTYNKYNISLSDNEKVNRKTVLNLSGSTYNKDNKYDIYGGKNKIIIRNADTGECEIKDVPINTACQISEHSFIEFYVLDGNSITFMFSKKPINTNFQLINNSADVSKNNRIFIECDSDFVFDISVDSGEIYANKITDISIELNNLTVNNNHRLNDFIVYEYDKEKNQEEYQINVRINNVTDPHMKIDSILIKELLTA